MSKFDDILKKTDWQKVLEHNASQDQNSPADIARMQRLIEAVQETASEYGRPALGKAAVADDENHIKIIVPATCSSFGPGTPHECRITLTAHEIERIIGVSLLAKSVGLKSVCCGFKGAEFCVRETGKVSCAGKEHDIQIFAPDEGHQEEQTTFRVAGTSNEGDMVFSGIIDIPIRFHSAPGDGLAWLSKHNRIA